MTYAHRTILVAAVALGLLVGLAGLAGCSRAATGDPDNDVVVPDRVIPADPDLSAPEPAVRSYLEWVSFAYRMANSDIPTATMTPWQAVRIDAYIELNRQNGEGIDQELLAFVVRSSSEDATSAVVAADERWRFRYFGLNTLRYTSDPLEVSYETTYTLTLVGDRWLVDQVEAEPLGPLE